MKKFNKKDYAVFATSIMIVIFAISYNEQLKAQNQIYFPHSLTDDEIKKYSTHGMKVVVIYPILTQNAYKPNGFYAFYNGTCGTCNIVSLKPYEINPTYNTGANGFDNLVQLHYPFITDLMVDKHPELLDEYDVIILLHNEYMTQNEFNAISHHKNVIYLYPNSMYVKVNVDYINLTMTLVRGHGYPDKSLANGFDYVTSSKGEYDLNCKNYKWESMPNGMQITCWPEFLIKSDRSLLETIKDYPDKTPNLVGIETKPINVTSLPICDYYGNCK